MNRLTNEPQPLHARVIRIFPQEGYGFLQARDGSDVYFHENSVLDGFDKLEVGTKVTYSVEMGTKGPQASSLHRG